LADATQLRVMEVCVMGYLRVGSKVAGSVAQQAS